MSAARRILLAGLVAYPFAVAIGYALSDRTLADPGTRIVARLIDLAIGLVAGFIIASIVGCSALRGFPERTPISTFITLS